MVASIAGGPGSVKPDQSRLRLRANLGATRMMRAMRRIRFLVRGRVQGVGFRAHTQATARNLGLVGFVPNEADGAVSGEAEGEDHALDAFVAWLHQGPRWSRIDAVVVAPTPGRGDEQSFTVRR